MRLKKLLFPLATSVAIVAASQNITYNVIASAGMAIAVVVDNQTYSLFNNKENSGILYSGEAPVSQFGYHYAILDARQQPSATESFSRAPMQEDTVYEFFNRSANTFNVSSLPQIYTPISDRIESQLHNRSYIPTIHIWGNNTAVEALHQNQSTNELEVKLSMTYYGLNEVFDFKNVEVQLAGRSSRWVPKLSYGVKMKSKGKDALYKYKKLKLRALAMDPTYVREYIAYSTLAAAGIPASGFSYVRLFINGQPVGLFGLIETFQDPWLANEFADGDDDYESGNLYQGNAASFDSQTLVFSDLRYYDNVTLYSLGEYKIKAGPGKHKKKPEKMYGELQDFTKFIQETNENTTVSQWEQRINTEGFVRAMAVENLLGFSDGYMTLADNYYVYNDPKNPGRMIYIPTDMDTTIGISLFDDKMMRSGNYSEHPGFNLRPLTRKLFSNSELLTSYQDKLKKMSQSLVNPTIMNPFIDNILEIIKNDVEWDQTLPRLGNASAQPGLDMSNVTQIGNLTDFLPPGFKTNLSELMSADTSTVDSVKGFLSDKSNNVRAFYNLTNN